MQEGGCLAVMETEENKKEEEELGHLHNSTLKWEERLSKRDDQLGIQ